MSLQIHDIRKSFGAVVANDGISLRVENGSLHGLLGENGAGKSTLMKVLSGFYPPDSGEVFVDGTAIPLGSPAAATAAGIGMLHQDPLVFLPLSVLDNVLLGSPGGLRLDRPGGREAVVALRDRFGFGFDLDAPARTLTVGERQQAEIVRLLWLGARILILDEPTTGISADQRIRLFETLRQLAADGMSVIFVSHKLEEVEELCGEVTVMRRGRVVGAVTMPVPPSQLVTLMFGQAVEPAERQDLPLGEAVLSMRGVTISERLVRMEGIDLAVRAGEVIGLAGMEGSGQRTFLRAVCGLVAPSAGVVEVGGVDLTTSSYRAHLDHGVGYLPAGRLEEGLVEGLTVSEHLVLADRSERSLLVDWRRAEAIARREIDRYAITGLPGSAVESLSGGNQQRLLLAMLPPELRVLLMEHPTRGLDIGSADWVWTKLLARREHGTAIVFASADLDELLRYSDRILVFFAGAIIAELDARATDLDAVGHLIGGRSGGTAGAAVSVETSG